MKIYQCVDRKNKKNYYKLGQNIRRLLNVLAQFYFARRSINVQVA